MGTKLTIPQNNSRELWGLDEVADWLGIEPEVLKRNYKLFHQRLDLPLPFSVRKSPKWNSLALLEWQLAMSPEKERRAIAKFSEWRKIFEINWRLRHRFSRERDAYLR